MFSLSKFSNSNFKYPHHRHISKKKCIFFFLFLLIFLSSLSTVLLLLLLLLLNHLENANNVYFVDGPAGTGKTYLFNSLLQHIRQDGSIALSCAASGTAAILLKGGRTAHSLFKIPLELNHSSTSSITPSSSFGRLLCSAKMIIWDEISLTSRYAVELADKLLRDLMENPDVLFGGKMVVFGGDFRQVLPVVPHGTKLDIIEQSLIKSYIWPSITRMHLTINMRIVTASNDNDRADVEEFSNYLLSIGNGDADFENSAIIHDDMLVRSDNVNDFVNMIYSNFEQGYDSVVDFFVITDKLKSLIKVLLI